MNILNYIGRNKMDKKEEREIKMIGKLKEGELNGEGEMLVERVTNLDLNIKAMKDIIRKANKTMKRYQLEKKKALLKLDKLFRGNKYDKV